MKKILIYFLLLMGTFVSAQNKTMQIYKDGNVVNSIKVSEIDRVQNGVNGGKFTDKATGKSLFLPAAGECGSNGTLVFAGLTGNYWSSTAYEYPETSACSYYLYFSSELVTSSVLSNSFGLSIRCVAE